MFQANEYIRASDFVALKQTVDQVLIQRKLPGRIKSYSVNPSTNNEVLTEHFNVPYEELYGLNASLLGEMTVSKGQEIQAATLGKVFRTAQEFLSGSHNCSSNCMGLCVTSCFGGCTDNCTSCTGCSGSCEGGCSSCTGRCDGSCTSACQNCCSLGGCYTGDCTGTCFSGLVKLGPGK